MSMIEAKKKMYYRFQNYDNRIKALQKDAFAET